MATNLYKEVKTFKGLKNDEDPKQISFEFFTSMKNFNYPDTGILGINKILMPKIISIFLLLDLELNVQDQIIMSNDSISTYLKSTDYLWDDPDSKWDLMVWS